MEQIRVIIDSQNSQVCTEDNLNLDLVEVLQRHAEEQPAPATYVVELGTLLGVTSVRQEKCLVIVLPETDSQDIPYLSRTLRVEVRVTPDGESAACLALADGNVAVSERAIAAAIPPGFSRLVTLWLFKDKKVLREYPYTSETDEDLGVATLVAQSHERPFDDQPPAESNVIELFDNFVMRGTPTERASA
ncbi:hypothetical protein WN982_27235 [Paraburkholderia sp. IMGN_8]|uniref:hypothetical protein n=1 Tax=Paraburkholderia sp. IMGN_8 TaxID=3136564 RepID=UPI0031011A87